MIRKITKSLSSYLYPPLDTAGSVAAASTQADSVLLLEAFRFQKNYRAGFYMLECRLHDGAAQDILRLSFLGSVDGSHTACSLPARPGKLAKRIVKLVTDVSTLWFERIDGATAASVPIPLHNIAFLRLIPLRRSFATTRMLRRLHVDESLLRQRAAHKNIAFLDFLYAVYDRSFVPSTDERYQQWIDYVEISQEGLDKQLASSQLQSAPHFFCATGYRAAENAQQLMTQALEENPQALVVYVDEDEIDQPGARKNPWFKPDWNPDLFLAQDYVSSCYACRYDWYIEHQTVFEHLGARLALSQLLPTLAAEAVLHLPKVLAHRISGDKADETQQSEWGAQRIAVLKTILPQEVVLSAGLLPGSVRVRYPLLEPVPLVSLIIPTRDGLEVLKPCVESILEKTVYANYEILILDNQSEQAGTLSWLAQIVRDEQRVRVLQYDKPFNYSALNNFGVRHARGVVIGLINNDVEVISPDWLMEMVSQAMRPEIGCVGAKLYYGNGQIQHSGVILGLGDVAGHAHRFAGYDDEGDHGRLQLVQNYSAVTAACLVVRREIYEQVGGLEEKHLTVAYNDVDFCIRVREAGYRNLWTPYAELYHHESISRGEDDTPAKKARYQKEVTYMQATWKAQLASDPCYNPNLCRRREDFSLPDVLF